MEQRAELRRGLAQLDGAIFFLLLLVVSILLSYRSMGIQRRQLLAALGGGEVTSDPSSRRLRCAASALTVGSLGFFLSLALDALCRSRGTARRSAQINALASVLVLGAALLRFYDLLLTGSGGADDLPPV